MAFEMNLTAIRTVYRLTHDKVDWMDAFIRNGWFIFETAKFCYARATGPAEGIHYLLGHHTCRQPFPSDLVGRLPQNPANPASECGYVIPFRRFRRLHELSYDDVELLGDFLDEGWRILATLKHTAESIDGWEERVNVQLGHENRQQELPAAYRRALGKYGTDLDSEITAAVTKRLRSAGPLSPTRRGTEKARSAKLEAAR